MKHIPQGAGQDQFGHVDAVHACSKVAVSVTEGLSFTLLCR